MTPDRAYLVGEKLPLCRDKRLWNAVQAPYPKFTRSISPNSSDLKISICEYLHPVLAKLEVNRHFPRSMHVSSDQISFPASSRKQGKISPVYLEIHVWARGAPRMSSQRKRNGNLGITDVLHYDGPSDDNCYGTTRVRSRLLVSCSAFVCMYRFFSLRGG